jgi:hypothetical protein
MAATNFNTQNDTYRKLIGNGLIYRVPRFQRDYSWDEEQWDDLWQDILETVREGGETAHYMGYLVLQSTEDRIFDVIDGQQRLTTLSLLILAALRHLKRLIDEGRDPDRTRQRLEGLRQTYVGYLDPVTLVPRSKLSLNRNNDHYYQTYLVPLADKPPQRGFKASEHRLRQAFEWFDRRIRTYISGNADPGHLIAQLIDLMSDRLFFTVITVTDELNAYKVFETLNARGVRLSATDLLKNYLFSVLHRENPHDNELKALDDRWEKIVDRLGSESFPDFLRGHWIGRHDLVRQSDLFKRIKHQVRGRRDAFGLLMGMDEDVDCYLALTSPDVSNWSAVAKEQARLLKMFSVRQPFPLLMVARRHLSDADFEALLRAVVIISLRYNVIGNLATGEQERSYHEASRVARDPNVTLKQILDSLRPIYPSDDAFRGAFASKTISTTQARNASIVRYILCELERHLDVGSGTLSIEHICPTNPKDDWQNFTDEEVEALSARLGNMTLLQSGQNKDLGNAGYALKRSVYQTSIYAMTRSVAAENGDWSPDRIAARQNAMAKTATAIWRISQLS